MKIDRRTVLRAGAVALGLPWLEAFGQDAPPPRRMALLHRPLGTYHPHLVPSSTGLGYETTRFLKPLEPFRGRFTLFSGMGHPGYPNDHGTEPAIFTGVPHLNVRDLHNGLSLDQAAARVVGRETRVPFLVLNRVNSQSLSWNEKGVPIPHDDDPAAVYRRLFVEGTPEEVRREEARLAQGKSILDDLRAQLKSLGGRLGPGDRARLEVLTHSIREAEAQLAQEAAWSRKPKPKVPVSLEEMRTPAPHWIAAQDRWLLLTHLALQTDSTRVAVVGLHEHGKADVPGLEIGHHDASHHGKDPAKIEQLSRYEDYEHQTVARFLKRLDDASLLDATQVLFTSNLGDASAHSSSNLPVLLAGGGYKHVGHAISNRPLCNLYVRMLRQLGVAADRFGSSDGVVDAIG